MGERRRIMANNIKGITIEIGGNSEKLEKSLGDVYKKSKNLTTEMKNIDKALRFNPDNLELVGQKQKVLSEQVDNTRKRLDELKSAQEQVNEQFKNGDISESQYRAFQREIAETESILKNYEGKLADVTEKHKVFGKKMEEVGDKFKNAGKKMKDVGGGLTKSVTAPLLAIGGASQVAYLKVDEAMDTIVTKTGATGDSLDELKDNFKNVSKSVPTDLQTVGDAIGEVNTQFGVTGESLEDLSEYMIKFAEINGTDVTNSSIKAKQAMETFGLAADDVPAILDAVTKTAQNTGQSTDSLFDSVVKGGPQLKELGLGFEESAALMGQFEQSGIDGDKALGYLSKSTVAFAKDGLSLQDGLVGLTEQLANAETDTEKMSIAAEIFGTKGAPFMLDALERGALDMDELSAASENASGTVSETFENTLDPADRMKQIFNDLMIAGHDLSLSIQETLAPAIETIADKLSAFTEWFTGLEDWQKDLIVKIGLTVAAIGPLLVIFGTIAGAIGNIISVAGTLMASWGAISAAGTALSGGLAATIGVIFSPVGLIIAGIAAVIAAGVWLWKNWDTVKEKAAQLSSWVSEKWTQLTTATKEKWNQLKDAITSKFEEAKTGVVNKATELKTNTINKFNELKTGATNKIKETVSSVKSKFSETYDAIMSPINRAKDAVSRAIETMKGFFNFNWSLPKIKMPHFSVSGSANPLNWLSQGVPKINVDWYAKGGIFTQPTILQNGVGLGEYRTGGEAVLPLNRLPQMMADAMDMARGGNEQTTIVQVFLGEEDITDFITERVDENLNKRAERNRRGKRI